MMQVWPLSVILNELKLEIPRGISQPIFSTTYNFRNVMLLNSLLLRISYNEDLSFFIQSIQERDSFPIQDLQYHTNTKSLFQGKLGYLELLFRGNNVKRRKRTDWYNLDLGVNIPPVNGIQYKSHLFRLYGIDRADFERDYFNEIGFPFSFEETLVSRLEKTRTGAYYALLLPSEKKDRGQGKNYLLGSSDDGVLVNEKYRFVVPNEKALESVLSIISSFRAADTPLVESSAVLKPKSIPVSIRKQVWRYYNGNEGTSPCFVCGIVLNALDYECGHIHSKSEGGKNIVSNLLPICGTCNKAMGNQHLFSYAEEHYTKLGCRCFSLPSYLEWKSSNKK